MIDGTFTQQSSYRFTSSQETAKMCCNKYWNLPKKNIVSFPKRAAIAFATSVFMTGAAQADEVSLSSLDGSLTISGTLISFEDDTYRIDSRLGIMEIAARRVICEGAACPDLTEFPSVIRVASSPDISDKILPRLVEGFGNSVLATLTTTTTDDGQDLVTLTSSRPDLANATITMASTTADPNEIVDGTKDFVFSSKQPQEQWQDATTTSVLALDGLVIVTSPGNPVRSISLADAAKIFAGEITNWKDIGGRDETINVFVMPEETELTDFFKEKVMGGAAESFADAAMQVSSADAMAGVISTDPSAIGFTGFDTASDVRPLAIRGNCGIQTVATPFTIKTEEYPLTRRIYAYGGAGVEQKLTSDFGSFLQSDLAQEIISDSGMVNQLVASVPVDEQGLRLISSVLPQDTEVSFDQLKELIRELIAAERLSVTLRFRSGASLLDPRAQGDIARIVEQIQKGLFANKEILLLGFTDSVGRGDLNEVLSNARANQVRNAILSQLSPENAQTVEITAIGYGEMMPLACNETTAGREINRRVEVWTRDIVQ